MQCPARNRTRIIYHYVHLEGLTWQLHAMVGEHSLMTSHVFWTFLTYLHTFYYSITSIFLGYLGPPYLPSLVWDVINERSLVQMHFFWWYENRPHLQFSLFYYYILFEWLPSFIVLLCLLFFHAFHQKPYKTPTVGHEVNNKIMFTKNIFTRKALLRCQQNWLVNLLLAH